MKNLKAQYATIRDSRKKISNIETAITNNQAVIDGDSALQDTVSALEVERQSVLVKAALGQDMAAELTRLDNAIIEAKTADKLANASNIDQLKIAQDTLAGLASALAAEQATLADSQETAAEMRKEILKARSAEYVAIYEKAAEQLFESLSSILAIDAVFLQHGGVHPKRGLAFQRENFKLSIPGINGGLTYQRVNGPDAGYVVDAEKYQLTSTHDHNTRIQDLKKLLDE